MSATRCKLRWPEVVATVSSPGTSLARPTLLGHLRIQARARRLGTTASPEASSHANEGEGDDSVTHVHVPYKPLAYEPQLVSYAEILRQAVSSPVTTSRQALEQTRRALQPGPRVPHDDFRTEDAPTPPLEHVLGRSILYLDLACRRIQAALSAVAQDVASNAVPKLYTGDFAALRTHNLGRWYLKALAFEAEYGPIKSYLNSVAFGTNKARRIVSRHFRPTAHSLQSQNTDAGHSISQNPGHFEAVAFAMAGELRAARKARKWREAWELEKKLSSTASTYLPYRPLSSTCHLLYNGDDKRITEISMARMAEWNDSYMAMYQEDVHTRKHMNVVKRYWTVFNSAAHEKPWQGGAVIFAARSLARDDKEFIVLRQDESAPPSPLWPRAWGPVDLTGTKNPAGQGPPGAAQKMKRKIIPTPSGTGSKRTRRGKNGKGPGSRGPGVYSLDLHDKSEVSEVSEVQEAQ